MAVRPTQRDITADDTAVIDALNEIRLQRNWSYSQLSDDMARAGFPVPPKTLQNIVSYRPKPYDRTLYQIRAYVAAVTAAAARKAARA